MEVLFAHAAAVEAGDIVGALGAARVELGTGKAAAAATLAARLERHPVRLVVLFGVCGAYPREHGGRGPWLEVGQLAWIGSDTLADEGVQTPDGFRDLDRLELGSCGPWLADEAWLEHARRRLPELPVVCGATVSTCSGTDAQSRRLAQRTGAQVETMEGAAVAMVCGRFGVPWLQLRCVSNRTGDRDRAGWDLSGAVHGVQRALLGLELEAPR